VVAAVHSVGGLRIATRLKPGEVDLIELRIDALAKNLAAVRKALPRLRPPVLLTVRHPAEGGIGSLSARRREELLLEFLPFAAFVDVELRSVRHLESVLSAAWRRGVVLVVSDHHFRSPPSLARMLARQRRAISVGADIFKLAVPTPDARSLARLLEFAARPGGRRAMMGMGTFGQVSRLALAAAGSVLNYGYLDRPNAPGQWEARELRKLLDRLSASGRERR
jgi:3-dehydroquinate dehydratase-1